MLLSLFFQYSFNAVVRNFEYKLSDDLKNELNTSSDEAVFPIVVWLSGIDEEYHLQHFEKALFDAKKHGVIRNDSVDGIKISENCEDSEQINIYNHIKRVSEKGLHLEYNSSIKAKLVRDYNINPDSINFNNYAPMIFGEMSKHDIYQLIQCPDVDFVYLYDDTIFEDEINIDNNDNPDRSQNSGDYPYGVWQIISNINVLRDALGYTGYGVKIGMIENKLPDLDGNSGNSSQLHSLFDYLINSGRLILHATGTNNQSVGNHATHVLSILTGHVPNEYSGVAPNATVYCTNYNPNKTLTQGSYFDGFDYLISEDVDVINASIAWGDIESNYNYIAKYLDYISSNNNITICMATGYTSDNNHEIHNGCMAYNILSVGNIDDMNTVSTYDDSLCESSRYSTGILNDTAYKPDLCAPGARAGTYISTNSISSGGGGTSSATPIVTGICALLMEAKPRLKTEPMLLKSILMSSAINLNSMTNVYSTDSSVNPALLRNYGAGMVDAYKAYNTINSNRIRYSDGNSQMQFTKEFTVSQNDIDLSRDIYISANWSQLITHTNNDYRIETNYSILYGFNHRLILYDPNNIIVAKSDYSLDRKQFIRYTPLKAGTYTIELSRYSNGSQTPAYYPELAISYNIK